jgi:hypothetical protein
MPDNDICDKCESDCDEPCAALNKLYQIYNAERNAEKTLIIKDLREELYLIDYEIAEDLEVLGKKVIEAIPELHFIKAYEIRIGYIRGYESKKDKGKAVNADCRIVKGTFTAYLPFDFLITFYEPNIEHLTDNQKKLLMLHELKHIGVGPRGFKIEDHDVEDFESMIRKYGIRWSSTHDDVPDILCRTLVGGEVVDSG